MKKSLILIPLAGTGALLTALALSRRKHSRSLPESASPDSGDTGRSGARPPPPELTISPAECFCRRYGQLRRSILQKNACHIKSALLLLHMKYNKLDNL